MRIAIACCLLALLLLVGCGAPTSFVRTVEPTWASVEVREGLTGEKAWQEVADTLIKRFDLEVLNAENGYLRTNWLYTWTGKFTDNYRVRVAIKFSPDRKVCEVKSEAKYYEYESGGWTMGYDSRLLETIKADIMGKIGRTTPMPTPETIDLAQTALALVAAERNDLQAKLASVTAERDALQVNLEIQFGARLLAETDLANLQAKLAPILALDLAHLEPGSGNCRRKVNWRPLALALDQISDLRRTVQPQPAAATPEPEPAPAKPKRKRSTKPKPKP